MSDDLINLVLAELRALTGDTKELGVTVGGILEKVTGLSDDVTELRGELTTTRVELMERMDRLQDTMASMRDDITVNLGQGQRAERIAFGFAEDTLSLSEQMAIMQRALLRVHGRLDDLENKT